jgi:hypothetical protein
MLAVRRLDQVRVAAMRRQELADDQAGGHGRGSGRV